LLEYLCEFGERVWPEMNGYLACEHNQPPGRSGAKVEGAQMVCLSSEDLKSEEGYSLQIGTLRRSGEHVKAPKRALLVQLEDGYDFWLRTTRLYFVSVASLTIGAAAWFTSSR